MLIFDCHGDFEEKDLSSYLVVDDKNDILLTGEDIINNNISAPIVFISACSTMPNYGYVNAILLATSKGLVFDLALLDQNLPSYLKENILSGSNIAELLKTHNQPCKTVIITSHTEVLVVYDILKKVNPDGLVIKNDVTASNFSKMIKSILNGDTYQSPLVKTYVAEIWKKEVMAEEHNRQILLFLSKGYRIKEQAIILNLASSTIHRRISDIKKAFVVSDNMELVKEAIKQGYL